MSGSAKAKKKDAKKASVNKQEKGRRGSVEKVSRFFRTPGRIMGPRLLFIFTAVALCCLGLVMIYSASSITAYTSSDFNNDPAYFVKRQALFLLVGLVLCAIVMAVPYKFWTSLPVSVILWGITVLMLILVAAGFGSTVLGADRSLRLGPFSLQPAEFVKITILLLMAQLGQRQRTGQISALRYWICVAAVAIISVFLIFVQPDLGSAIILVVGVLALLFLGGASVFIIVGVVVIAILYVLVVCVLQPYHITRIMMFINPWSDPQGDGYQSIQSKLAFSSGGIFGTGLGLSRQKYAYLPYAYNDFIFAVIGEELGLVGALGVIVLFCLFIYAGIRIARTAPDVVGSSIAGAMTTMIGFQAFVNMACVIGIAPVTGKALPFISYGGSSIISTMIMVGFVLNVSLRSKLDARNERRRDDLRVLDGGRKRNQSSGTKKGSSAAATRKSNPLTALAQRASGAASATKNQQTGRSSQRSGRSQSQRSSGRSSSSTTRGTSSRNTSRAGSRGASSARSGQGGARTQRTSSGARTQNNSQARRSSGSASRQRSAGSRQAPSNKSNSSATPKGRLNYSQANRQTPASTRTRNKRR